MEWVTGTKLSLLPKDEVRQLAKVGQEAFLTQLLEIGVPSKLGPALVLDLYAITEWKLD